MKDKNFLGQEPVQKLLVKFAVPSIISMVIGALYNIVDQFFIGHSIGELGNAATNVAFPLSTSCVALALLFGVGGAAAFNLTMGRGKPEKAVFYIGNAAMMLFVSGMILCVVTLVFLKPLLKLFGAPGDVLPYAVEYTGITAFGFPFLVLSTGGGHLVRADGNPRAAMFCNIAGAVINTVLDAVFVFGLQMGMRGAALATVIGQMVAAGMIIANLIKFKTVALSKEHLHMRREYVGFLTRLGVANFFNQIAMMVVQIILNKSLTYYGGMSQYGDAIPLACAGIISKVGMVFFSICIGLSHGMQPIASFNYGAGNYQKVKEVYLLALKIGTLISCIAFFAFQIFPRQIIGLFGDGGSEAYYLFAVRYFRIYMFFVFLNAVQPISSNLFTSIGKPGKGVFLSLTRQILFLLPLIVIFPLFLGIDGIMYAAPIADFVAAVVSGILVRKEFREMNKKIAQKENQACESLL
nr:MATE family efflux transporter [Lachnospiraceae bacterium]